MYPTLLPGIPKEDSPGMPPNTEIVPSSSFFNPTILDKTVVFPHPLAPNKAYLKKKKHRILLDSCYELDIINNSFLHEDHIHIFLTCHPLEELDLGSITLVAYCLLGRSILMLFVFVQYPCCQLLLGNLFFLRIFQPLL